MALYINTSIDQMVTQQLKAITVFSLKEIGKLPFTKCRHAEQNQTMVYKQGWEGISCIYNVKGHNYLRSPHLLNYQIYNIGQKQ